MIVLGNKELLNNRLAVVLNSSQSKTPCGNDSWIEATKIAVKDLINSGHTIITSLGLITWELPVHLASIAGGGQIIVCPFFDEIDGHSIFKKTLADFALDESRTAMIFVRPDGKARFPKDNWLKRDESAIALSHSIFPISIRPNGRLQKLLTAEGNTNKIDNRYCIQYKKAVVERSRYEIKNTQNDFGQWDYIAHWTRTCYGPWPGESYFDFYRKLLKSQSEYPNSAFHSLLNIAKEKKIRASSNRIREGRKVIGFSEASPRGILQMLRWCPRRVNWNFEPYGIAIIKTAVHRLGIRQVTYGDDNKYKTLLEADKPFFQNRGSRDVDWSREQELRHLGELDLNLLTDNEITYIVWNQDEASQLESETRAKVISFINS